MEYDVIINEGNENLGIDEKTITVRTILEKGKAKEFYREMYYHNRLVPTQVVDNVIESFCAVAVSLMAEGRTICLYSKNDDKKDVAIRLYPEVQLNGNYKRINIERAKELDPTVTEITPENAAELVAKHGVTCHIRADVRPRFSQLLKDQKPELTRRNVVVKKKIKKH